MKRLCISILGFALAACGTNELALHDSQAEDHTDLVVLEGAALRAELTDSPVRKAPVAFRRVALMWDAQSEQALEFQVSADGVSWSDWQPVSIQHSEAEDGTRALTGALDLPEGMHHYRVRQQGSELASFAVLGFMEQPVSKEAPTEPEDADDSLGTHGQGLSYGAAAVNTRASWGARAPRCKSLMSPYRFTIHHTVTPTNDSMSPQARIRQIQSFHMDSRGYCDIAYNLLVSRDGRLWEGRGAAVLGGHAANANGGNIGISVLGTYTHDSATNAQLDAMGALLKGLGTSFGIAVNGNTTKGHRQVGTTATACPGNALYGQIPTIIQRANSGSAAVGADGCTGAQRSACGNYGCGCADGKCSGGFACAGSGCSASQTAACGAYGCGCVDGQCSGGFCAGTGCSVKDTQNCAAFGCGCVDGACSGGFCAGSGCTAKQTQDCGGYGCGCADGKCAGGYCAGSGCTAKQTNDCGGYGCGCADGKCAGAFCPGSGCTAKQTNDCAAFGCGCSAGKCAGGFCAAG